MNTDSKISCVESKPILRQFNFTRKLEKWKGHCLGGKIQLLGDAGCEENPRRSPKFGGSGKFDDRGLESTIRSRIQAYSRQSDFGRGHFGRVNFNDSHLLEPANRSISFLAFDCR